MNRRMAASRREQTWGQASLEPWGQTNCLRPRGLESLASLESLKAGKPSPVAAPLCGALSRIMRVRSPAFPKGHSRGLEGGGLARPPKKIGRDVLPVQKASSVAAPLCGALSRNILRQTLGKVARTRTKNDRVGQANALNEFIGKKFFGCLSGGRLYSLHWSWLGPILSGRRPRAAGD